MNWTHSRAIQLCCVVEEIAPMFGCHVALTGGTLYKGGLRKDCDLLFYRIRQTPQIDMLGLWTALRAAGLNKKSGFGWCYKAEYTDPYNDPFTNIGFVGNVDCFFPEAARNPDGSEIEYSP